MMMTYGHVYVGSICLGDAQQMSHAINTINKAVSYDGPSVVIAYTPCIEFGIKGGLENSLPHMVAAVRICTKNASYSNRTVFCKS